jgi:hypothetical protein
MAKKTYPWRAISIGYEMRTPPTTPEERVRAVAQLTAAGHTLQTRLRADFAAEYRIRWATGDQTELAAPAQDDGDAWVARVLAKELDEARVEGLKPFVVDDEHVLCMRRERPGTDTSDWPGTACKLVDNRWVNGRSFEIDAPSPEWGVTPNMLLFVTLEWLCEGPAVEAERRLANGTANGQRNGGSKSG